MESKFLLPHRYKLIGWFLLVPSFIMGVLWMAGVRAVVNAPVFALWSTNQELFTIINKNIYNEIVMIPLLASLMIVTFTKEKHEDEYIMKLRLDSLVWSIYINFSLLIVAIIFIFRDGYYNIMIYNQFTVLILFIIRFNFVLYKNKHQLDNEK
jgi:hypothetical protein